MLLYTLFAYISLLQAAPAADPIDLSAAKATFELAERLWNADNGKLWGMSLRGPLIFVEPRSRFAVANEPDHQGILTKKEGVFVGKLPAGVPISNFSLTWAGVKWIMIVWPLPADPAERAVLLMHEPFHRAQEKLGLPATNPANHHLDSMKGRYWMQLEWQALAAALLAPEEANRMEHLRDALLFRAVRRSLIPDARVQERSLEMHEGLANYTGVALSGMTRQQQQTYCANHLKKAAETFPSFTRSFAYLSGPAYGLLLDAKGGQWRQKLRPEQDFSALIQNLYRLPDVEPSLRQAEQRALKYDGEAIHQAETQREEQRQQRAAAYRKQLVDGPVLVLPMIKAQRQFNPSNLFPLDDLGTVYPTLQVIDVWGTVTVNQAALLSSDYKKLTLPAPIHAEDPTKGPGWKLELKPNWSLQPAEKPGDWKLVEKK